MTSVVILSSQEKLVTAIRKGDLASYSHLYDTYSEALFGVICRKCSNVKIAEEILLQSFIKIREGMSAFDNTKQHLLPWMLSIARSVAIEVHKKNTEIQKPSSNVSGNTPLSLVYLDGYTLEEAAEILKISAKSLKIKLANEIKQISTAKNR